MDFNNIIGHEKIIDILKNSIGNGSVSHSYIFEGEDGLGKKRVAMVFAKTLLCKEKGREPCNTCSSCLKFDSRNHPDFNLIQPEKGLIRKGEIENLIQSLTTAPFESNRKIFILDDSHRINIEGMNAILKTLEEPPEYANIILIAPSSTNLLPTVVSRCQGIKFYPVEIPKIVDFLGKQYNIPREKGEFIAEFTKGSVGKSIEISQSEDFFEKREEIIDIINDLIKGNKIRAFNSINFFNQNKENIEELLDIFLFWFRDLSIYKAIGKTDLIINKDKIDILSQQSHMDFNKINDIIEKIQETKINLRRNLNFQLTIETMLLNIQEE